MTEALSFDVIARDLFSKTFSEGGKAAEGFHGKLSALAGLAGGAAGAGLASLGEHLEETRKVLQTAVQNAGQSFDAFAGQIDAAGKHEERFGHGTADTNEALTVLTRATGNVKTSLADMNLVTELAAAHHSSLAAAADQVARMHAGAFRALKEFGINVKDTAGKVSALKQAHTEVTVAEAAAAKANEHLADVHALLAGKTKLTTSEQLSLRHAQEAAFVASLKLRKAHDDLAAATSAGGKAMDFAQAKTLILQKIHGTAAAQADTFGGKIKALKTHLGDMTAELGAHVGPALMVAGPALGGIGQIVTSGVIPAVLKATISFGSMAAGAVVSFATMIAAAASWAAGMVVSAATAMAPFLPFIAIAVAVGVAAYELYKHWDTVWSGIKAATGAAIGFVKGLLGDLIGFFKNIPGWIGDAMKNLANIITAPYRLAFKLIAKLWNNTIGKLHFHLPSWIPGIGGKGFDAPTLPEDVKGFARGVRNFSGGLALVGEEGPELLDLPSGSDVIPNSQLGSVLGAGGVHVEHLEVNTSADPYRSARELMYEFKVLSLLGT